MAKYVEIDCDGDTAMLERLRSLLRGKFEHFAIVQFRSGEKKYRYGITTGAARDLHDFLQNPDSAKTNGKSLGRMLQQMKKSGTLMSDQEFARADANERPSSTVRQCLDFRS